ncbi:type VI secretion system tip protein TssI/VgrG, partial [Pantoea phytobeneficialis]
AKGDDTSSCWVRVSSAWAGQGFGGVQIPRVGDEVVVDFINGDPDRPLIIGRVYNEASMPPWALPAAATQMGFLSRSKDGTSDTANALRFEDKAGEEQLWIQAQKNMDTNVKNDETHSVGGSRTVSVTQDYNGTVSGSHTEATQLAHSQLVGGGFIQRVQGAIVQASDSGIRLVAGQSVLELGANGQVTLQCVNFNIDASGTGQINTGGTLDLNLKQPGALPAVEPTPAQIQDAVKAAFNQGKDNA